MKELLPLEEPAIKPPPRARHAVRVRDPKTEQEVTIVSDERLVAFCLDDESRRWWNEGEPHTDAVVIAEWNGEPVVLFIELTLSVKLKERKATSSRTAVVVDPIARKERQIDGIVAHFHPSSRTGGPRTEGDDHHDDWRDGRDRPRILPAADHRVGAIVIGFHQQARQHLAPKVVGGVTVRRAVWSPVPSARQRATVTFGQIAGQLGW